MNFNKDFEFLVQKIVGVPKKSLLHSIMGFGGMDISAKKSRSAWHGVSVCTSGILINRLAHVCAYIRTYVRTCVRTHVGTYVLT